MDVQLFFFLLQILNFNITGDVFEEEEEPKLTSELMSLGRLLSALVELQNFHYRLFCNTEGSDYSQVLCFRVLPRIFRLCNTGIKSKKGINSFK